MKQRKALSTRRRDAAFIRQYFPLYTNAIAEGNTALYANLCRKMHKRNAVARRLFIIYAPKQFPHHC